MIKNYLLISTRSLKKHLSYSLINISGLGLGLAICILLLTWINHELSYDNFHKNADDIYRVSLEYSFGGQTSKTSVSPTALLPTLKKNFASVDDGVRVYNPSSRNPFIVKNDDKFFQESKFFFADSTFFKIFSFHLLKGNEAQVLQAPRSVVISQTMAKKYFGDEDPVGKILEINNKDNYTVTGLMEDVPKNSLLQFDFVASFSSLRASQEQIWWSANYETFIIIHPKTDISVLETETNKIVQNALASDLASPGDYVKYNFMPLKNIYLKSDMDESFSVGDIHYVYILGIIAILVLFIACINYINLATAKASERAKEVGIRKVVGALRQQLFFQFIGESIVVTLLSLLLALILSTISLPLFNSLTGKSFNVWSIINAPFLSLSLLVSVLIALLAGTYPAVAITSYKPVSILKGNFKTSGKGIWLRKSLVIFQFCISVTLITGTLVIIKQVDFIQAKKLGFEKENTIVLPLDDKTDKIYNQLKTEI